MKNLEDKIKELIEPKVTELGYEVYDVEYVKFSKEYYLRIYIDKENGITLEDCELVSNSINDLLDEADYIKEQYYLEVSSPGIERIIKNDRHLEQNMGKLIDISLYTKFEGKKNFQGELSFFDDKDVKIVTADEELCFERKNIAQIKQVYKW